MKLNNNIFFIIKFEKLNKLQFIYLPFLKNLFKFPFFLVKNNIYIINLNFKELVNFLLELKEIKLKVYNFFYLFFFNIKYLNYSNNLLKDLNLNIIYIYIYFFKILFILLQFVLNLFFKLMFLLKKLC